MGTSAGKVAEYRRARREEQQEQGGAAAAAASPDEQKDAEGSEKPAAERPSRMPKELQKGRRRLPPGVHLEERNLACARVQSGLPSALSTRSSSLCRIAAVS